MTAGALVGRTRELGRLEELLAAAGAGRPATALLGGEPGVGKSRLLSEFAEWARVSGACVLQGACIELGGGVIPYAPLIEALRLLVRANGEAQVREMAGPAWAELAGLISDFTGSAPAGPPVGAPGSQLHVFGAVLRVLDHLGRDRPVALIFEDLHWADPSTLDLVSYLTRAKSNERTLLVCSHRTGLPAGHPLRVLLAEPDFARRTTRIELPRFTESELRRFLGALGLVDRDHLRRGFELSDGNAFFAEQLTVSGALTEPGTQRIPESLNELMQARIRVLNKDATRVMRVAATAARRVSDQLLAAVCGLDDDALGEALRECLTEGMLVADPTDDTYSFRHALLREAVYESLIPRERKRLHTEMAQAITADSALSLAEDLSAAVELAHHWYSAGRGTEALTAAVRAGTMAARLRAFPAAETQYNRALRLWPLVPAADRPTSTTHERLLADAADAARWSGHVQQAVDLVLDAIREVDAAAHPRRAGELHERLGRYQWEAGASQQSVLAYEQASRLLADGPADAVDARVLAGLATAQLLAGHYTEGLRQAEAAAELAERIGATAERGRALNTAGLALNMLGLAEEGVPRLREAVRIAKEEDNLEDLLRAYSNLCLALERTGGLADAVEAALLGLTQARRFGLAGTRQGGVLANNAGAALFQLGRWDEAAELLEETLLEQPRIRESVYPRLTLAQLEVSRGRFAEAERLLGEIRDRPTVDPLFLEVLFACEAELALWREDPDTASTAVERALTAIGEAENKLTRLRLYAIGLWAAADLSRTAQEADRAEAISRGEALYAEARRVTADWQGPPEAEVVVQLCAVERDRARGEDTAAAWEAVAVAWDALDRPYPAAYARWRQAAALDAADDRDGAMRAVRAASAQAEQLRAEPLRGELERLAAGRPGPAASPQDGRRGLTDREIEVLRELVKGDGNRQIARTLFIAENTVGVHVHRILTKLGVKSRGEAIALVLRTGLLDD